MTDEPRRIKQVIVVRHDLKMRRGKQIAQGAHASMSFICRRLQERGTISLDDLSSAERTWLAEIDDDLKNLKAHLHEIIDERLEMIRRKIYRSILKWRLGGQMERS